MQHRYSPVQWSASGGGGAAWYDRGGAGWSDPKIGPLAAQGHNEKLCRSRGWRGLKHQPLRAQQAGLATMIHVSRLVPFTGAAAVIRDLQVLAGSANDWIVVKRLCEQPGDKLDGQQSENEGSPERM